MRRELTEEERQQRREYLRTWRLAHPPTDKLRQADRERARQWRLDNPEKERERRRAWDTANAAHKRAYAQQWDIANPGRRKKSRNKWRAANPEKAQESIQGLKKWAEDNAEKVKEIRRDWKRANPEKVRQYELKAKYGLTPEAYTELYIKQDGKCAICCIQFDIVNRTVIPHVDHCHDTGQVRGLLCAPCNNRLVASIESPLFQKALDYVQSFDTAQRNEKHA